LLAIATDLDGTVLDLETYSYEGVPEEASRLASLGIPVVVATSKTIWEAWLYWRRLGFEGPGGALFIVEVGGAVAGEPGVLAYHDWVDPETGLEVVNLAPTIDRLEGLIEEAIPPACRGFITRLSRAGEELVARILGLPRGEAVLASRRLYDEALWSPRPECLEEAQARALRLGFNVRRGARVLHLTMARGKGAALKMLPRLAPALEGARWAALGDSPSDADMLEASDYPIVVPHKGGIGVRPRRLDYLVALEPAPAGWVWAIRRVVEGLLWH
jgi:mannosyl-3-phosphoglycerate phosphatase